MKDKKLIIILCLAVILVLSLGINGYFGYYYYKDSSNTDEIVEDELIKDEEELVQVALVEEEENEIREFVVDIKGEVNKPGIYKLSEGSRVQDVIEKAGGLKKGASTNNINLSKKISDEMVIYIYKASELKKKDDNSNIATTCTVNTEIISSCEGAGIIEVDNGTNNSDNKDDSPVITGKVSINTGTLEELMTLDGVGEAKAKAIIAYREKNGLFTSLEQIMNVSGIGEAAYSKIKDNITL